MTEGATTEAVSETREPDPRISAAVAPVARVLGLACDARDAFRDPLGPPEHVLLASTEPALRDDRDAGLTSGELRALADLLTPVPGEGALARVRDAARAYRDAQSAWKAFDLGDEGPAKVAEAQRLIADVASAGPALDAALATAGDGWEELDPESAHVDRKAWIVCWTHPDDGTRVVGEAYRHAEDGRWWWAGTSPGGHGEEAIDPQPTHRRPMPAPPATMRNRVAA